MISTKKEKIIEQEADEVLKEFENLGGLMRNFLGLSGTASAVPHSGRMTSEELKRAPRTRNQPESTRILNRGWEFVSSVPYKVTLRWLFYKLFQEGFYKNKKKDYKNKFCPLFSRARLSFDKDWRPDTFVDEGRAVIASVIGCRDDAEAFEAMKENIRDAALVPRDHFFKQKNYIELWFEARAMISQFQYYTKGIDLVPMSGTRSISYGWEIAKRLEIAAVRYGKPIVILYFGDEDEAGHKIQQRIGKDVRAWAKTDFRLIWCGLTMAQVRHYEIPENFEKKGFQWEALSDEGAKEIITNAIRKYIDPDLIEEADEAAGDFADLWRKRIEKILKKADRRN